MKNPELRLRVRDAAKQYGYTYVDVAKACDVPYSVINLLNYGSINVDIYEKRINVWLDGLSATDCLDWAKIERIGYWRMHVKTGAGYVGLKNHKLRFEDVNKVKNYFEKVNKLNKKV